MNARVTKLDPNKKVMYFNIENTTKKPIAITILNPSKILSYKFPKGIKLEYTHGDYQSMLLKFLTKKAIISKLTYRIPPGKNDQFKNVIQFGHDDSFGAGDFICGYPVECATPEQRTKTGRLKKNVTEIVIYPIVKYELNSDSYIKILIDAGQKIKWAFSFEFIQ